jgi:D-3-phosphoglycerate dehydrogenase / 2-oxoglutarate reductase
VKAYVLDDFQGVVAHLDAVRLLAGSGVELEVLTRHLAEDELIARLGDADALVLIRERTQVTARLVESLPRLRLVVQTGRLAGCIDLAACERRGVAVREGSGSPVAPAELTWALVLAASRRLVPYAEQLRRGVWQRTMPDVVDKAADQAADKAAGEALGTALEGRTLGVWALGKIGSRVAGYGKAFGMRVLAHGREATRAAAEAAGYEYAADRRAFLGELDVLTLHLKLNRETRHLIGPDDLAALRPEALLVNTSRAELIAPGALLAALDQGRPGAAALDVFEDEPEGARSYVEHPRVLATPHLGFVERSTYEAYFKTAFGQLRDFAASRSKPL